MLLENQWTFGHNGSDISERPLENTIQKLGVHNNMENVIISITSVSTTNQETCYSTK